jgi:hypothetical protein
VGFDQPSQGIDGKAVYVIAQKTIIFTSNTCNICYTDL